jgi:peptidoglycan/LPS O-acetylase OafA/YrhL
LLFTRAAEDSAYAVRPEAKYAARDASRHVVFLDGVRGLAAAYVVLHHASLNVPADYLDNAWNQALTYVFSLGHYSVDTFIVLSGYCLALPLLTSAREFSTSEFLARRAVRIVPTYYAAGLVSLALIATVIGEKTGTHWDLSVPVTRLDIVAHLLLVHECLARTASTVNHAFWSVGVEWKLYFVFPILLWLRRRYGMARAAALAIVVGYALWLVLWAKQWLNPSPWGTCVYYLGLFAMGMAAAEAATRRANTGEERYARLALLVVSLQLTLVTVQNFSQPFNPVVFQIDSFFVGLWSATLLVALERNAVPFLRRWVELGPVATLGRMGYSLYLIHAPVLQLVYLYIIRPLDLPKTVAMPCMLVISFAASVVAAAVLYRFVERPFHALSRSVSVRFWPHADGPASLTAPWNESEPGLLRTPAVVTEAHRAPE